MSVNREKDKLKQQHHDRSSHCKARHAAFLPSDMIETCPNKCKNTPSVSAKHFVLHSRRNRIRLAKHGFSLRKPFSGSDEVRTAVDLAGRGSSSEHSEGEETRVFVCRRCARAGESVLKGMRPLEQETLRSEAIPRLLLSVTAVPQALAGRLGGVVKVRAQ